MISVPVRKWRCSLDLDSIVVGSLRLDLSSEVGRQNSEVLSLSNH